MRLGAIALLAVIPLSVPEVPPAPCAIAIEMQVRAPLESGTVEWRAMFGEVERIWAPYGLRFCWETDGERCAGLEVRLRVLVSDRAAPPRIGAPSADALAWIRLREGKPGHEVMLSIDRARAMIEQTRLGSRALAAWPAGLVNHLLPTVLGRALAHEVGHVVLGSPAHTRTGLMASHYMPQQAAFGPRGSFRLPEREAAALRRQCAASQVAAR